VSVAYTKSLQLQVTNFTCSSSVYVSPSKMIDLGAGGVADGAGEVADGGGGEGGKGEIAAGDGEVGVDDGEVVQAVKENVTNTIAIIPSPLIFFSMVRGRFIASPFGT